MRRRRAYCPGCDAEGALGQMCTAPACRADARVFIPEGHYLALRELPAALRDRRLGQRLGGAVLVERLSRGAFGRLYLGLVLPFEMRVAVKVFEPLESSGIERDELAEMFEREGRALAALSHPNVVRLYAFEASHDPPYLVMELVEGGRNLRHLLESLPLEGLRRLPVPRAEAILNQIAWALVQAHERGVVHLDLRPDNIGLQDAPGYDDFVRVLDFGLATHRDDEELARGFGTPVYIAPERIVGAPATPAADLYALGVMAHELLVGRSPFAAQDADDIVALKRSPTFDPGAALAGADYPRPVVDFFRRALAHSPSDRFDDARTFVAALARVARHFDESSP